MAEGAIIVFASKGTGRRAALKLNHSRNRCAGRFLYKYGAQPLHSCVLFCSSSESLPHQLSYTEIWRILAHGQASRFHSRRSRPADVVTFVGMHVPPFLVYAHTRLSTRRCFTDLLICVLRPLCSPTPSPQPHTISLSNTHTQHVLNYSRVQ